MKHPVLPTDEQHPLPFYLAMEEWVARHLPPDDYFFVWRVNPTVICGRNQDIEKEVNLPYCHSNGINIVRRRSGGGCVYADMDNWMFSYITSDEEVSTTFSRYTSMVADMLSSLGFEATASGRNDIFIGDRKVAGNAFYHIPGRSIVHGTMLCDFNPERMANAITPSRAKLESKAVQSVPSHITCLKKEGMKMTVEEFGRYAVDYITGGDDIILSADDIAEIKTIEQNYYSPEYFMGRHNRCHGAASGTEIHRHIRLENAGEFDIFIGLNERREIDNLRISGDFFAVGDIENKLINPLKRIEYSFSSLSAAISSLDPSSVIRGLDRESLLTLLI